MGTTTSAFEGARLEELVKKHQQWAVFKGKIDWNEGKKLFQELFPEQEREEQELKELSFSDDQRVTLTGGRGLPVHDYFHSEWQGTWAKKGDQDLSFTFTSETINHEHTMEMASMIETEKVDISATADQLKVVDGVPHFTFHFKGKEWEFYSRNEEIRKAEEERQAVAKAQQEKTGEIERLFQEKTSHGSLSHFVVGVYGWHHTHQPKRDTEARSIIDSMNPTTYSTLRFFKDFTFELTRNTHHFHSNTNVTFTGKWEEEEEEKEEKGGGGEGEKKVSKSQLAGSQIKLHIQQHTIASTIDAKVPKTRTSSGDQVGSFGFVARLSDTQILVKYADQQLEMSSSS